LLSEHVSPTIRIRYDDAIRPNTNRLFGPLFGTEANTDRIFGTSLLRVECCMWLQYISESMSVSLSSRTALDQCSTLYLLLAWRDLLVVLASTKVILSS